MARWLAFPLLLVSACAKPSGAELVCRALPFDVFAEVPLDCGAVRFDVATARASLESAPLRWRLSAEEFDSAFLGMPVIVHASPTFSRDGRSWVGRFSVADGVELGSRGDALPHELMHAVDVQRGQLLTGLHPGWDWDFDTAITDRMSGAWSP